MALAVCSFAVASAYSFANTPLSAAHAPLVMANTSHLVCVVDMLFMCTRCVGDDRGLYGLRTCAKTFCSIYISH